MAVKATPAPTRGWNARDSLDQMKEDDAIRLDNWLPRAGKCEMRGGSSSYATGLGADVRTLAEFDDGASVDFLAGANGNIWDISSSGAGSSLASGFSVDYWDTCTFNGSQAWVNGTDTPQIYNGSTVGNLTVSASGLTVTNLVAVSSYKSRTYFCENSTLSFWYSATNALGGTLTEFLLNRVAQKGGYLMAIGTWSRDSGLGPDDVFIAVTSKGEVLIYQGSDPGNADDWALIGRYVAAPPIGRRCLVSLGGELILITIDGFVPISTIINGVRGKGAVSDRIRPAVVDAAQTYGSIQGWEAVFYPRGGYMLFNVPITSDTTYHQYVVNTSDNPGAWCRFKNWNGRCLGIFNDRLYFGGDGIVWLADDGHADNSANIEIDGQSAFTYLSDREHIKQFSGVRPVISSEGDVSIGTAIAVDFGRLSTVSLTASDDASGSGWGDDDWDEADWAGDEVINNYWGPAGDIGYNISSQVLIRAQGQKVKWFSTNYMYQRGGVI